MLFTQFNMTTCAGSDDFFKIKKFMDNFQTMFEPFKDLPLIAMTKAPSASQRAPAAVVKPKNQPKPVNRTVTAPAEKKAAPKKEEDDSLKPLS